jgi:hypothetical protein
MKIPVAVPEHLRGDILLVVLLALVAGIILSIVAAHDRALYRDATATARAARDTFQLLNDSLSDRLAQPCTVLGPYDRVIRGKAPTQ